MLRSMTVTNHLDESLTIELENPNPSGFQVAGIDGLGPPKADLFMSNRAANDGSVFNSARVDSRNIVIRLVYVGSDIEKCRHDSYKYFPTKKNIRLVFKNDSREIRIDGYVESNEIAIFSKMEGSVISIMCPDPWFIDNTDTNVAQTISTVESLFEFEYLDPSVVSEGQVRFGDWEIHPSDAEPVDDRYIEFSRVENTNSGSIKYAGDVDIGITLQLFLSSNPGNIKIINQDKEEMNISASVISRVIGGNMQNGDVIVITTGTGNKTARLLRGGVYKNIIAAINKSSVWFTLSRGDNVFVIRTANSIDSISCLISSQILYEGV